MRKVVVVGAGGRDFHDFNVVLRDDPEVEVVAFTAAQIPGIANRTYPASLAGPRYPDGIPIHSEDELGALIDEREVDEVVFAYSDLSHEQVMHRAELALSHGAKFSILGPRRTMLPSRRKVVAVCAVRTGAGKSQISREIGRILSDAGVKAALVRHPMPYHDLDRIAVQRFESIADIDASNPTIEEREEYEAPVEMGLVMYAGVDYAGILAAAEEEAEVVLWDGGNNDMPFFKPDLMFTVADPLRPEDGLLYHPGEANLRMADVVIVNKVDSATDEQIERALADVAAVNPDATVVRLASPVRLESDVDIAGKRVLVIEDGPSVTHGGLPVGAGTIAARAAGAAEIVDPREYAVGSIAETFAAWPHIESVLPAMGYGADQLRELEETVDAADCDAVVTGTPINLARIISSRHPIHHARYGVEHVSGPTLEELLEPIIGGG